MAREHLTDRKIRSLKASKKRYEVMDASVPGLGVRVSEAGKKTFILFVRYPGSRHPSRRELGEYDEEASSRLNGTDGSWQGLRLLSLEQARAKAREWKRLIKHRIDPTVPLRTDGALQKNKTPLGHVFAAYCEKVLVGADENKPLQRRGKRVRRNLEKYFFLPRELNGRRWSSLSSVPIDEVTDDEILMVVDDAKRNGDFAAHHALSDIKTMYNWAIASSRYGIKVSPCDRIRPRAAIGPKRKRKRSLSEEEIGALWIVSSEIGYAYGDLYKLVLLTGVRLREAANASWGEFNIRQRLWTIPAGRMKGDAPHLVPLSDEALELLASLPRHSGEGAGDYLFSTRNGSAPINGFSKGYRRMREKMQFEMMRYHNAIGNQLNEVVLEHFHLHDVRRTVRTMLPPLGVQVEIAELVIAHAKPGLHAIYDQYAYLPEKREALEKWGKRLMEIVQQYAQDTGRI